MPAAARVHSGQFTAKAAPAKCRTRGDAPAPAWDVGRGTIQCSAPSVILEMGRAALPLARCVGGESE